MLAIPATWEAKKMEGLWVKASQDKKIVRAHLKQQAGLWWFAHVIPATWEAQVGDHSPRLAPAKSLRPYLKSKKHWRLGSNDRAPI
jgi:hypothetical protein